MRIEAISQKISHILAQTPTEQQEGLRAELLKMLPQEGSEVKLKIGNGIYPEDNESSMGIFVEIHHAQKATENYDLLGIWQMILSHTEAKYQKNLEEMLDFFEKDAVQPYGLSFNPTVYIDPTTGCAYFRLTGKIGVVSDSQI